MVTEGSDDPRAVVTKGSGDTKPTVFAGKVAAAGDEGQLREADAAFIVSTCNRFFHGVLQRVDANRSVMPA